MLRQSQPFSDVGIAAAIREEGSFRHALFGAGRALKPPASAITVRRNASSIDLAIGYGDMALFLDFLNRFFVVIQALFED